ncbi:hypothetical protein O0I10_008712 [Lichtheimia ornata]|uniref:Retrotransposon gag domain-containing protein n=1 Tax=Lichtheimia ornata TaxID=688661 RepID=A0AAD7XST2_9FUNG|nr:uncharacterized protein O0I10_008712 [Lichtheimia ornata]KAJ8655624.1 hypothetical protein O0I10_008712 [Lichtheimia ornata]
MALFLRPSDSDNHGNNQGNNNNSAPAPEGSRQSGSGETSVSQTTTGSSAPEKVHTGSTEKHPQQIFSPLDQPGAPAPITGLHVDGSNLQEGFEEAVLVAQQRVLALSIEQSKHQVSSQRDQVTRIRANLVDAQVHLESLLRTKRLMEQFQQQVAAPTPSPSLSSASSESSTASTSASTTNDATYKSGKLPVPHNMPWLQIEGHHKHNINKSKDVHSTIDRYIQRFDAVLSGYGMVKDENWERLLSMHILEEDFSWFEDTLADRHLPWCEAKEIIRSHFGSSLSRQKMSAKVWTLNMRKTETFRAYEKRFRTARRAGGVPDNNALAMKFLGSLSKSLRVEIQTIFRRQNITPNSITDVANQARDIADDFSDESASDDDRGRPSRSSRRSRRSRSSSPSRSASPVRRRGPKKQPKNDEDNPHSIKGCKYHGAKAHHTTEVCNQKGLKKPYKPSASLLASKHAPSSSSKPSSTPCWHCGEPFDYGHLAVCKASKGKGKATGERVVRALRPASKSKDSQPAPAASDSGGSDDDMDIDQKAQVTDLYSKLGIYIGGLPYSFDENNDSDIEEEIGCIDVPNDSPAGNSLERALLERTLKPLIEANQQIPKNAFCTVPESKISLDTIDDVTERVKSYPVPKKWEPLLDETVQMVGRWHHYLCT